LVVLERKRAGKLRFQLLLDIDTLESLGKAFGARLDLIFRDRVSRDRHGDQARSCQERGNGHHSTCAHDGPASGRTNLPDKSSVEQASRSHYSADPPGAGAGATLGVGTGATGGAFGAGESRGAVFVSLEVGAALPA